MFILWQRMMIFQERGNNTTSVHERNVYNTANWMYWNWKSIWHFMDNLKKYTIVLKYVLVRVRLGQKYYTSQVQLNWGSNPWPPAISPLPHFYKEVHCFCVKKVIYFPLFLFWFKYNLGQKYQSPQVRPNRGSYSWPADHDSTFHVTEMLALTTRPSVTCIFCHSLLLPVCNYTDYYKAGYE